MRLGDRGDERFEFVDGGVDVDALLLQLGDLLGAALDRREALGAAVVAEVVEVEQFLDVGERQADPAAAQDPREAGAVAGRIEPLGAAALGREQGLVLVEAERAGGDAEVGAHLADGEGRVSASRASRRECRTFT